MKEDQPITKTNKQAVIPKIVQESDITLYRPSQFNSGAKLSNIGDEIPNRKKKMREEIKTATSATLGPNSFRLKRKFKIGNIRNPISKRMHPPRQMKPPIDGLTSRPLKTTFPKKKETKVISKPKPKTNII